MHKVHAFCCVMLLFDIDHALQGCFAHNGANALCQVPTKQLWKICVMHYNDVIMSAMASLITDVSIVYSNVRSGADQINQSSVSLAFVRGIYRWPVNSPHKGPVTVNISIWWRHHGNHMQLSCSYLQWKWKWYLTQKSSLYTLSFFLENYVWIYLECWTIYWCIVSVLFIRLFC